MPKKRITCPRGTCNWVAIRGGKRERCTNCGDTFPCAHTCGHIDCCVARGDALPEGICELLGTAALEIVR